MMCLLRARKQLKQKVSKSALVVLTAAGSGMRLGQDVPKALVRIGEHTILAWALNGLAAAKNIAHVCVTAPDGAVQDFAAEAASLQLPFEVSMVVGGLSRQRSVWNGLEKLKPLSSPDSPVLIHDAARCFTPASLIDRVITDVKAGNPAVIPGLPVTDTIKEVGPGELAPIVATPDRRKLRSIQTPQGFQWETLWAAHSKFYLEGDNEETAATDDGVMVERLGVSAVVCKGDKRAHKITTFDDIKYAEALLL